MLLGSEICIFPFLYDGGTRFTFISSESRHIEAQLLHFIRNFFWKWRFFAKFANSGFLVKRFKEALKWWISRNNWIDIIIGMWGTHQKRSDLHSMFLSGKISWFLRLIFGFSLWLLRKTGFFRLKSFFFSKMVHSMGQKPWYSETTINLQQNGI